MVMRFQATDLCRPPSSLCLSHGPRSWYTFVIVFVRLVRGNNLHWGPTSHKTSPNRVEWFYGNYDYVVPTLQTILATEMGPPTYTYPGLVIAVALGSRPSTSQIISTPDSYVVNEWHDIVHSPHFTRAEAPTRQWPTYLIPNTNTKGCSHSRRNKDPTKHLTAQEKKNEDKYEAACHHNQPRDQGFYPSWVYSNSIDGMAGPDRYHRAAEDECHLVLLGWKWNQEYSDVGQCINLNSLGLDLIQCPNVARIWAHPGFIDNNGCAPLSIPAICNTTHWSSMDREYVRYHWSCTWGVGSDMWLNLIWDTWIKDQLKKVGISVGCDFGIRSV